MSNSGKLEVLIPRSLCEIEKADILNVDDENLASVFIAWEKGIVSELKPINIENKLKITYKDPFTKGSVADHVNNETANGSYNKYMVINIVANSS